MRQLRVDKLFHGFRLKRSFEVPEFRLLAAEIIHEKTSAKYWHLQRDDPNRTYSVQFRTTPSSDSGVSHILEHTVLCGSSKYPVRDPFFKMLHRSQANFMNALTANDWTMYPFATMNETDFQNLFRIYTDAVFNPKLNEVDFMQEGWRLEPKDMSDLSSKLQLKGVVYNEMKGVFSNALNRFGQTVQNQLFPKTYGFVSGGHPESIPSLSWEALKAFHSSCYHPTNACFYSYGNVNLEWCLEHLNKEYLEPYDTLVLDNEVAMEPIWDASRTVELVCEPDPMAHDPDRQCIVSLSYRLDDIRNIYENFVLGLLSKLLIEGDNAPLYRGLIESGYGLDWAGSICGMDNGARTTSMHVGVQGVRSEDLASFSQRTRDILEGVVRDGFPAERIEATLHQYELAVRHDSARFGLNLIFALSHAINHNADVEQLLRIQDLVKRFRDDLQARPSLLQDMVQKYFLDNKHILLATMKPDDGYRSEQTKKETELQTKYVDGVRTDERERWIAKSKELLEKQQLEEDISCLPCLELYDIPLECRPEPFTMTQANGCAVQLNEAATNGVVYFHALADLKSLPKELLIYVPLFCDLFPKLGAGDLSYSEMDQAIDLHTGGLYVSPHVAPLVPNTGTELGQLNVSDTRLNVHFSGHCLESKLPNFFELWSKLFRLPTWSDRQRLLTLILMSASGDWSANVIADSAHRFAMGRAAANLSPTCRVQELWSGLEQAALVKQIASRLGKDSVESDSVLTEITEQLMAIWRHISDQTRLRFSVHAESHGLSLTLPQLDQFVLDLTQSPRELNAESAVLSTGSLDRLPTNSYFCMPYSVHYAGQALPAPSYDSPDYATYRVLANLMTSKYLHREIREKGGAYGGRSMAKPEALLFFSYRDPHAQRTFETFRKSLEWAQSSELSAQDIDEAKLAVFQELDQPISAGSRGLNHFLRGVDDDLRQQHRNQLFVVDSAKLHSTAEHLLTQLPMSGCTILGPEESPDWTFKQDTEQPKWERVVMSD